MEIGHQQVVITMDFYVKNLDDNRQLASARTTSELVGGPVNVYFTQPRTAGVTFTYNF